MRFDMAKVIVERPRHGSRDRSKAKGYDRRLRRVGLDAFRREGIKRLSGGGTKMLNEHLGPLRRFLDSQVGRPWDKVFAEICAHINRDSAVQDHVRDHVEGYVATQVKLIDGVPYSDHVRFGRNRPLFESYWVRWYVCPRTRLLRRVTRPHRQPSPPGRPPELTVPVRVGDSLQCRLIDGAWHLVILKPIEDCETPRSERDVVFNRPVAELSAAMARKHYGGLLFAAAKRLLGKRELRQYPIPIDAW